MKKLSYSDPFLSRLVTPEGNKLLIRIAILPVFVLLLFQQAAGQTKHKVILMEEVVVVGTAKMTPHAISKPLPFTKPQPDWSGSVVDSFTGKPLQGIIIHISYGRTWEDIQTDDRGFFSVTQRYKANVCGFSEKESINQVLFIHPYYFSMTVSFSQFDEMMKSGLPIRLVKRHSLDAISQLLQGKENL